MADWHDVMEARSDANRHAHNCEVYGGQVEDGEREGNLALAVMLAAVGNLALAVKLAAVAVASEFRALSVALHHALRRG